MPTPNAACEVCGAPFYASPGHVRLGWGRFCSIACRNVAWTGSGNPRWGGDGNGRICVVCGKPFHVKPSHIAKGEGTYCSPECARSRYPRRVQIACQYCGKVFDVPPSRTRKGAVRYCSKECALAAVAPKPNCECKTCGKLFYLKPCDLRRNTTKGNGSYCSMECKARWMSNHATSSGKARGHGGKRADLGGLFVRSSWEANWARYLNWLRDNGQITGWAYEAETFEFPVRRGSRFYTPDFRVTNPDGSVEYHEVKGYMDAKSATKIRRFRKYYPGHKLILIEADTYYDMGAKIGKALPNWEAYS